MSDWADFCDEFGIDPNDPDQFDDLLSYICSDEPILTNRITGHRATLRQLANENCSRCNGTGYISCFKRICGGRCFKCIPDWIWSQYTGGN